ncbi:MAG: hypothetical protein AAB562_00295 [Patescibacteria group bacterium]
MSILALVAVFGPPIAGFLLGFHVSSFFLAGVFTIGALLAFASIQALRKTRPGEAGDFRELLFQFLFGCAWAIATSFVGYVHYSDVWW